MNTDEYEISLSREIAVCRSTLEKCRRVLRDLEKKYAVSTEQMLSTKGGPSAAVPQKEALRWREAARALEIWTERLQEYQALYDRFRSKSCPASKDIERGT